MSDNTIDQLSRDLERARARIAELEAAGPELRHARPDLPREMQEWQRFIAALRDPVCLLDTAGIIQQCNEGMVQLLGKPQTEIVGRPCVELVHGGSARPAGCPFERALQTRHKETLDFQLNNRWFQAVIDPILDGDGQVTGAVHILMDITERKQAEDLLQAQHELALALSTASSLEDGLRLCLEAALRVSAMDCGGIYVLDKDCGALDLVLHRGLSLDFVQAAAHYDADSASARLVKAGEPVYTEYVHLGVPLDDVRRREGLHAIAILPLCHEDRLIGCLNVASHTRDEVSASARVALETIADQVGSPVARLQAAQALRASEDRYRQLFEQSPIGISTASLDGQVISANKAMETITGYSVEELKKTNLRDTYEDREDEENLRQTLERQGFVTDYPVRLKRKDGTPYDALLTISRVRSGGQQFLQTICQDITERKQAEAAQQEAEARYRALFDNAGNAIAVYRAVEGGGDFVFVDFNRAAESTDGILREAVIGRRVTEAFPRVKDFGLFDVLRRVWETGKAERLPDALYQDGRIAGWRDNYVYKLPSGEVVAIYSDETARKQAEAEIQQLARFPGENPNPVLRVAEDATLLLANRAASPLLAQWGCAVGQHLPEPWAQRIQDALRSGTPSELEVQCGQRVLLLTLAPVLGGAYVNLYGLDITVRKRAEDAVRRSGEELAGLYDTALALTSQLDLPPLLQTIVVRATDLLAAKSGSLYLYRLEQDDLELVVDQGAWRDYKGTILKRGEGLAGKALESKEQMSVDNYHTWAGRAAVFEDAPLGAVLAVPVTWAGQILGVINVEREAGAAFDEPEARLLSLFANQVAVALANARLLQQAEARRRHIEALLDINTTLRSTLPLHEVLEMIARRTGEALGYIGTLILVPDANGKELRVAATWGSGLQGALTKVRTRSLSGSRLPLSAEGNPIVQAYLRHDLQTTSGEPERPLAGLNPTVALKRGALLSGAMGAKRGLYLGLHYGDKPQGVLLAFSSRTDLAEEERSLLLGLAGQAGLAIENARLFAEVGAARERLEGLSRRLVTVQEEERRHIARELHDEVGQLLTGLKITMDMAQTAPASETEERLSEAQALVGQLLAQVRELSLALRPAMLDDLGLLPALLWNTNHYSAQTGIHVRFTHYGLRGRHFPPEVETAIYRIAQEALTNVARHAGVIEVAVRVWAAADALILEVHDEGRGFDPVAALAAASPGLVGMHERVTLLGGQLVVESAPGKGTSVRATFPIDGTAPDRKEG